MREVRYKGGDHWVTCARTGDTIRKSQSMVEPKTGFIVGKGVVDMPHPQIYRTPVKADKQTVYPVRPPQLDRVASAGGELPDGTVSDLPQLPQGEISATAVQFLGDTEVDPTTF